MCNICSIFNRPLMGCPFTGGHGGAHRPGRRSSRTRGHSLLPLLYICGEWQGERGGHTPHNGTECPTNHRQSQRSEACLWFSMYLSSWIVTVRSYNVLIVGVVDYLVIRPIHGLQCDMSASFTKYWKKRGALDVGHRGAGSTHTAKWVLQSVWSCMQTDRWGITFT